MTISFETDHGTVLLPETSAMALDAEKARQSIKRDRNFRRSHLYPLLDAVANFACSLLFVPQGCSEFGPYRAPWIMSVGDDMHFAWGPQAFGHDLFSAAISSADQCVMITSGPDPFPYRAAATFAVRDRKNVLLIETLPHQQEAWRTCIEAVRGDDVLATLFCVPEPQERTAA